ncbi:ATP-binding protein [Granulicella mallensis]|uniref:histidine kinase n=1 Tax=Granulicella mallensis TaxID=940614 RepID=A0A7W7ZQP3_9BACT|nr:ATP-binding protein [Granulicella mallensis]MBB5063987.1 PAS domain S-box-containing protein [Granulicella mallensis]
MPTVAINPEALLRVLIIEDYEEDALLLQRHLARAGYKVDARRIETAAELKAALEEPAAWDLVIADYTLPTFGARDALKLIQKSGIDLPFIIVSGTIDEVSAVNAMRAGAHDYVLKGHLERLLPAIERELADSARRQERLRTEAELRLAQQRFSATFNQAAVGMAHTSIEGRFLLVNQRLAGMLGEPIDKLLALQLRDFLLASERELDRTIHAELISGGRSGYRVERTLIRHDGSTFPAQLTASLLKPDGHLHPTVLWVVEDISARKAAEKETTELMTRLINSERLAAAGRMANTLAHEINNPLEALTNIFYLLQTHEDLPTQSREMVEIAAREIERVGHITRSTLSFYRKLPGRTIDLRTMLEEVVQLFQSRARQHNVKINTRYADDTSSVHYDPALRQVFANLVGNALEAMEGRSGSITVRARLAGGFAAVTVSDTGHGIDQANLQSIFEPFFTTKGERGTGLGLWVTRGIVEEQGGTLRLRSCISGKRGTTIRIRLPISAPAKIIPALL